jgi:flagellar biosynthesis/type III secretory pathway chaperone
MPDIAIGIRSLKGTVAMTDNENNRMNPGRVAMERADVSIETLFQEKLIRYHELVDVLKEERKQIDEADVTALWQMNEKKQSLAGEIEKIRGRILDAVTAMSIDHGMSPKNFQTSRLLSLLPAEQKKQLNEVQSSLMALKKEIQNICLDNKKYVESKLGVIDELISIMTGRGHQRQAYGAKPNGNGSDAPMLFRREA